MNVTKEQKRTKGERTRETIFRTAVSLFQVKGYDQTTMRDIAAACDVAIGNAYYYFESKEHIVFALYQRTLELQRDQCREALTGEVGFLDRTRALIESNFNVLAPYHSVFRTLFKAAADPDSSLSPFGPDSAIIRIGAQSMFAAAIEGIKFPNEIKERLPYLLWLYYMGLALYWLHDSDPSKAKTLKLMRLTTQLIDYFLRVVTAPMMNPIWKLVVNIIDEFRLDITPSSQA